MISLQKLFGKDDQFFTLLEASAEECRVGVKALRTVIVTKAAGSLNLNEFVECRRKDKEITNKISELICTVSVTALEREDIEALSNALYKIPKTLEKFAERYIASFVEVKDVDFSRQVKLLEEASDIIATLLRELRTKFNMEKVKVQNHRLQQIEGEADKLILELLIELYSRRYDAIKVVILKDLYELLEKVVDRFRDAGNVISHIVLKNG